MNSASTPRSFVVTQSDLPQTLALVASFATAGAARASGTATASTAYARRLILGSFRKDASTHRYNRRPPPVPGFAAAALNNWAVAADPSGDERRRVGPRPGDGRHEGRAAPLEPSPLAHPPPVAGPERGDRDRAAGRGLRRGDPEPGRRHALRAPGLQPPRRGRRLPGDPLPQLARARAARACVRRRLHGRQLAAAVGVEAQRPVALGPREGGPARDRVRRLRDA